MSKYVNLAIRNVEHRGFTTTISYESHPGYPDPAYFSCKYNADIYVSGKFTSEALAISAWKIKVDDFLDSLPENNGEWFGKFETCVDHDPNEGGCDGVYILEDKFKIVLEQYMKWSKSNVG